MVHCHVSKISKISTPSPPKKVITKQKLKKSPSHFSQHLSMNRHEGHFCALQAQGQHQEGGTQTLWAQPEASRHAGFKKDMPSKQKNMLHMWVEVRHRSWWPFRGKTWRFFLEGKNPPKWSIGKKKTTSWNNSKHFRQAHRWTNHTNRCGASRPNSAHRLATARCSASLRALSVMVMMWCMPSIQFYKRPILPWKRWKDNVKSFYHPCILFINIISLISKWLPETKHLAKTRYCGPKLNSRKRAAARTPATSCGPIVRRSHLSKRS